MKIHYRATKPYLSHAFRRIEEGIASTLPNGFEMVEEQDQADLVICPIVNINDTKNLPKQPHIIWQLCYLTAGTGKWFDVWSNALMVVSYLKLPIEYLRLPLGYNSEIFNPIGRTTPKYDVVVTGYVDEDDNGEVISRLVDHFPKVMHVGRNFNIRKPGYYHAENVSDTQLAEIYRNSKYVAGMRMIEGFELPIIEGAACGCKPITLDLECYRHWFDGLAFFVDPEHMDTDLKLASRMNWYEPVRTQKFTWENVMKEFWNTLMNGVMK